MLSLSSRLGASAYNNLLSGGTVKRLSAVNHGLRHRANRSESVSVKLYFEGFL